MYSFFVLIPFQGTGTDFQVTIPPEAPACDRCTFSWSWINASGNRELYMNCADIRIENPSGSGALSGPRMVVANLAGSPTIPEFLPGADDGSSLFDQAPIIAIGPGSPAASPKKVRRKPRSRRSQ
jgi:hypothetical protein